MLTRRQNPSVLRRTVDRLLAATLVAGAALATVSGPPAATPVAAAGSSRPQPAMPARTVTLVTGDRVTATGSDLADVSVQRGSGRDGVTFLVNRVAGRLRVVPSDVLPLLRTGRLDSRLFDVTTLLESGYDDRRADLPLIVTYTDGTKGRAARSGTATAGAQILRTLPGRGTFAVRARKRNETTIWQRLASGASGADRWPDRLADGVEKVWLDGATPAHVGCQRPADRRAGGLAGGLHRCRGDRRRAGHGHRRQPSRPGWAGDRRG
jgi:hypothetical protein